MRPLCLLLCLLMLLPLPAMAEEDTIYVTVEAHRVGFSFEMPDQEFVYVKYDTRQDSGEMVLYSPDGHFEGECYLPATGDGSRMGLNVFSLANRQLLQGRVDTQAVETAEKPEQSVSGGSGKVEDAGFALSPSGKLSYSFKVPGRDTVKLKCKSPQEWHILTLDARDGYRYEGEISMPYTYPDDTVTVSVISTNSYTLYEKTLQMPYQAPSAPAFARGSRLRGVTVCVDPGHQRSTQIETVDLGPTLPQKVTTTVGMAKGIETARMESQVVLEIGMLLRNALMEEGAAVAVTRDKQDTFVGMLERADIPNSIGADFVLRLHCNYRSGSNVQGIEIYCPLTSSYAQETASQEEYRLMGETMLTCMQEATGVTRGGCTLNNTYVGNNWSMMPSFLIEMGYMTSFEEDLKLSHPEYQQRLVEGMVEGVIRMARMRGLIE